MLRECLRKSDLDPLVYFFTICFGVGSWITINGLWVELPSIVPFVPESWTLPSYLSIIAQIANIGPIAVTLCHAYAPGKMKESVVAYLIIAISAASCILLALTWRMEAMISGTKHSVALLVLVFFTSIADCTSSVVFIPFMSIYKPVYMTALYIGEGMSGLLPGFVALGQGVGVSSCQNVSRLNHTTNQTYYELNKVYEGLNFPVRDFFFFLCGMMVMSGLGFTMLNFLPYCKREQVDSREKSVSDVSMPHVAGPSAPGHYMQNTDISTYSVLSEDSISTDKTTTSTTDTVEISTPHMHKHHHIYFLVVIGIVNFIGNGLLSSINTYSSLPYGERAFHLSTTLANISNPVACFIALVFRVRSVYYISVLWAIWGAVSGYIICLASTSPSPPLVNTTTGAVVMVMTSVAATALFSYIKVCIAVLMREKGKSSLVWLGAITQLGSFLGSLLGFALVNVGQVFRGGDQSC